MDPEEVFRDNGSFAGWPHALGRFRLNPLYRVTPTAEGATLSLELPTEWFARENAGLKEYMPERLEVPRSALEDVEAQRPTAEIDALIRRCVVLGLPEAYG